MDMCQHHTFVFALVTTVAAAFVGFAGLQADAEFESLANAPVCTPGNRRTYP